MVILGSFRQATNLLALASVLPACSVATKRTTLPYRVVLRIDYIMHVKGIIDNVPNFREKNKR